MNNTPIVNKRGYLNRDYMFFHLKKASTEELDFHYHEFDKIVFILSGSVTYIIEGKAYVCRKGDILLVNHHDIHKPVFSKDSEYERCVIWMNHDFIYAHSTEEDDLSRCFSLAKKRSMCLYRFPETEQQELLKYLYGLEDSFESEEFASKIMANAFFLQFLVLLNRYAQIDETSESSELVKYNKRINDIIEYINDNLSKDLSVDTIADSFFMSKSHLMHKFKEATGYSVHNYILQKRLLYSRKLLSQGVPVVEAAEQCGFNDYTTYLRAFKKLFHTLPSEYNGD